MQRTNYIIFTQSKFVSVHIRKAYRGIESQLHSFLRSALIVLQGEHKVFSWLQIFITRKLCGIQTFFSNVSQLKKFFTTYYYTSTCAPDADLL